MPHPALLSICRLANYAEWFQEDTVFSRICRWSDDRRPASIRHSLPSYSASRNASRRSLGLKRTRLRRSYGLSLVRGPPPLCVRDGRRNRWIIRKYSSVIMSSLPQLKVRHKGKLCRFDYKQLTVNLGKNQPIRHNSQVGICDGSVAAGSR